MKELGTSKFFSHSKFMDNFSPSANDLGKWRILSRRYSEWLSMGAAISPCIPKRLHQIWIGSPLPETYTIFSETWKKHHPDWDYILWDNEKILALRDFPAKNAYLRAKSYGVKSDIARYEILKQFGGVYADTDFECVASFDSLVGKSTFFAGVIFGNDPEIANGLIGAVPNHPVIEYMCESTAKIKTSTTEIMDIIHLTGPGLITKAFFSLLDELPISDIVLPSQYFYPFPNFSKHEGISQEEIRSHISTESMAIHYWDVSWSRVDLVGWVIRKWNRLLKKIRRLISGA